MSKKDFHKLFELVIDDLLIKADQNIESFNISYEDDWEDFYFGDETQTRKCHTMMRTVHWDEKNSKRHASVSFSTGLGTMKININNHRHEISVGYGTEFPELKKKFIRLYKKVEFFREVEKVQQELDLFYVAVQDNFPSAIDQLILESHHDEESGNSGRVPEKRGSDKKV